MRITVLGKSPSWQDAGGACSGYLVEEGDTRLLLDCGNGVFAKLRRFRDYVDVDAVVISHLHADHFLDLVPFAYALTYAPRQQPVPVDRWPGTDAPGAPAPATRRAGARETFRRVVGAWGSEDLIENAFDLREYDRRRRRSRSATLRVRFHEVPHFLPTLRGRDRARRNGGGRFTYGADCAPNDELVALRRRHRPADDRGDAAAPRARRRRAATSRPPRPASTAPRARAGAARHHAHLRRARRAAGRATRPSSAFGGPVARRRARAPSTTV